MISKSVNIGKNIKWEADATGQLQSAIVELGLEHIEIFVKKIRTLPVDRVSHLIKFLADVENHKAYPEYQLLIDKLNKNGYSQLANKFINARALREQVKE